MKPRYQPEVFRNRRGRWQWRIRHRNGQILATSEEYSSKSKAAKTQRNLFLWVLATAPRWGGSATKSTR